MVKKIKKISPLDFLHYIYLLYLFFFLKPLANWRNFAYEIKVYFQQWIGRLQVNTFNELSELIIVSQIRHNLPAECKEHVVEELLVIKKIDDLVNKLDVYETARRVYFYTKRTTRNISGSLEEKRFRAAGYTNSKGRRADTRHGVNQEYSNFNPQRIFKTDENRNPKIGAKTRKGK